MRLGRWGGWLVGWFSGMANRCEFVPGILVFLEAREAVISLVYEAHSWLEGNYRHLCAEDLGYFIPSLSLGSERKDRNLPT